MQGRSFSPQENVYLVYNQGTAEPLGTCFPFEGKRTFLTAAHVVQGAANDDLRIVAYRGSFTDWGVSNVVKHPEADVAVLWTKGGQRNEQFEAKRDLSESFPGSDPVMSCGYAVRTDADNDEPEFVLRSAHGYVQRQESRNGRGGEYVRYELSYPAFRGNSGSPVVLQNAPKSVIGVVTHGYTFWSRFGRIQALEKIEEQRAVGYWTMAVSISSIQDWLDRTVRQANVRLVR